MADIIDHKQELFENGIYLLMDDISNEICAPAIRWILAENCIKSNKKKKLQLIISSDGGELSAAFALIDIMKGSKIPIHTLGLGIVSSAGLLIFSAGHDRVLTPNTSVLSHQYSWSSDGKHHELIASVAEMELIEKRMIQHYIKVTGLSKKAIMDELLPAHDVWLTPEEAKKYNLCDIVRKIY